MPHINMDSRGKMKIEPRKCNYRPRSTRYLVTIDRAMAELNRARIAENLPNDPVETIVVFDKNRGKLNCYGRFIDASFLAGLNTNFAVRGKNTTCQVSYPKRAVIGLAYRRGRFVHSSQLGITGINFYLALVSIPEKTGGEFVSTPYRIAG